MANQCDGCIRGLPVDEYGIHRGPGGFWAGDIQRCTRDRYGPKCPPAVVITSQGENISVNWNPEKEQR